MSHKRTLFTALALAALVTTTVQAATIRVARDGSGDFTIVPEAVLAAASGDTILIGPGVYPEVQVFDTPGGPVAYVAEVEVAELTIIGAGRDEVVLGPESPATDLQGGPGGIVTSVTGNIRVRGVTVRNTHAGVWGNDAWIDVRDSRFVGNYRGVAMTMTGAGTIKNCEFVSNESRGVVVFNSRGGSGSQVEDSAFIDNAIGVDFQPSGCSVRNSTFERGFGGVQVSFGGSADIRDCTFTGMITVGVGLLGGSQAYLYDNVFQPDMPQNIIVTGRLVGSGNELLGGTFATLRVIGTDTVLDFRGNHILNAGGWSVDARSSAGPPGTTHDLSGNYWGTTDTDQIDEWIQDRADEPVANFVVVNYLPLAEQPISEQTSSFGRFKARFRQ